MHDRRLIHFARELRRNSTDAERRVWSCLRAGRLGGHVFRRQHPVGKYIADFYCHAARLVVELDGGQHAEADAAASDARRTAVMAAAGMHVIRFSDYDALTDTEAVALTILQEVERRLTAGPPPPLPSPGVPGEGGERG